METGALRVPEKAYCKIVFIHSIRGKIESGVGRKEKYCYIFKRTGRNDFQGQ